MALLLWVGRMENLEMAAQKRKKTPSRVPGSLFIPNMVEGRWSRFDAWLREVLFLYIKYAEVTKQKLSADGRPDVDTFGRPRPADDAPDQGQGHGIKLGAVWFTRETLRAAWTIVFKQYANAIDVPESQDGTKPHGSGHVAGEDRAERGYINHSHPMDQFITRMVKDGRLIRKAKNRYMLSRDECKRLDLPEVWEVHTARGARWEQLFYEEQHVLRSELGGKKKKWQYESEEVVLMRPKSLIEGKRHVNEPLWDETYRQLEHYLYFDRHVVYSIAKDQGLDLSNVLVVTNHLSRWLKMGKVKKVLPSFYQSSQFDMWNRTKRGKMKPKVPDADSWFVMWLKHWCFVQVKNPDTYFTAISVYEHFNEDADEVLERWVDKHYPNGLARATIAAMLTTYKKKGYLVAKPGRVGYRASADMITLFSPLWIKPDVLAGERNKMIQLQRIFDLPLDEAISTLPKTAHSDVIFELIWKIQRETDELAFFNHLRAVAKRIDQGPVSLFQGYTEYLRENGRD